MEELSEFKEWLSAIHKSILNKSQKTNYTYLYGIDIDNNDIVLLTSGQGDPYDLIALPSTKTYYDIYDMICLVLGGWAAPVDEEMTIPPSEHPHAKRVRLTNYLSHESKAIISALDIDGQNETVWEYEQNTRGTLRDALETLYTENH
jgi:hypothetical protein